MDFKETPYLSHLRSPSESDNLTATRTAPVGIARSPRLAGTAWTLLFIF